MPANPDFLIIGAMKCGTTVLYDFICMHPHVSKAALKEIHYFSLYRSNGEDWYRNHFNKTTDEITGEASPTYFHCAFTPELPTAIKTAHPRAKLILIVRDPVERAISHFVHLQIINKVPELIATDINDFFARPFESAVSQTSSIDYYLHDVLSFSCYQRRMLTFLQVYDRSEILVLSNSDLLMQPRRTMSRVFDFLGLEPFETETFTEVRYSAGAMIERVNLQTFEKLSKFLYPDYKRFCDTTGLTYERCSHPRLTLAAEPPTANETQSSVADDVSIGRDGWLFLKGGSNELFSYYQKPRFDSTLVSAWDRLFESRLKRSDELGIRYLHLFAPNKLSVYPEYSLEPLPHFSAHPIRAYLTAPRRPLFLQDHSVDPIPFFQRIKKEHQIYWKTDSHWTYQGCFCAYQLICAKLGVASRPDLIARPFVEGELTMDLGGKLAPPVREKARFYEVIRDSRRTNANAFVAYKESTNRHNDPGLHVGSNVVYCNDQAAARFKLVLFGDSFSEYRAHLLTGMLAETFMEVHFVWSSSIDWSYVERVRPDILLTELVERFMPSVPRDDFELEAFVRDRMSVLNSAGP